MAPIWRVSIAYVTCLTAVGAAWPYLPSPGIVARTTVDATELTT